jgi:hypothetical protein
MNRIVKYILSFICLLICSNGQLTAQDKQNPSDSLMQDSAKRIFNSFLEKSGLNICTETNTSVIRGRVHEEDTVFHFTIYTLNQSKIRHETLLDRDTLKLVYDGRQAWGIFPWKGKDTIFLPDDVSERLALQIQLDTLLKYTDTLHNKILYRGMYDIDTSKTYNIFFENDSIDFQCNLFIDTSSYRLLAIKQPMTVMYTESDVESFFYHYKTFGERTVSTKIITTIWGQEQRTVAIDTVEFGIELNDSLFSIKRDSLTVDSLKTEEKILKSKE